MAALSLHSLLSLRSCLSHACLLLNADAPSLETLVGTPRYAPTLGDPLPSEHRSGPLASSPADARAESAETRPAAAIRINRLPFAHAQPAAAPSLLYAARAYGYVPNDDEGVEQLGQVQRARTLCAAH